MTKSATNTTAAQQNNPKYRESRHPWHLPYNSRCLISGCDTKVYHDGKTYFSLCLLHLEELHLGPFFRNKNKQDDPYG